MGGHVKEAEKRTSGRGRTERGEETCTSFSDYMEDLKPKLIGSVGLVT